MALGNENALLKEYIKHINKTNEALYAILGIANFNLALWKIST